MTFTSGCLFLMSCPTFKATDNTMSFSLQVAPRVPGSLPPCPASNTMVKGVAAWFAKAKTVQTVRSNSIFLTFIVLSSVGMCCKNKGIPSTSQKNWFSLCLKTLRMGEMNAMALLEKYLGDNPPLFHLVCDHSKRVVEKALWIADKHPELNLNRLFLEEAGMIHDIGVFLTHAPSI